MSLEDEYEVLVEVWRITEMRGGAVYRTEFLEERWVPMAQRWGPGRDSGLVYASIRRHVNPRRRREPSDGAE